MAGFLANEINVRDAWKLMITLTNCCPLTLQNAFLDRTHKAILHSWYIEHGYLPIEYPNPGDSLIVKGPIREAVPGCYENASMVDVKSAYLTCASSKQLRLYDEEDPPAFTSVMQKFLELIRQFPKQKPMLKFLAVSLVGSQHSDNNFLRRQTIYTDVVEGFAEEFAGYLSKLPLSPFYIHTDGYLTSTSMQPPPFAGYELPIGSRDPG
ncbi:MAG TPA: hypothetical protein VGS11_04600 [Candidatus Bathyarchaeia archaeon]|nr:hypothetical protein [Candidatus Bathyarchaeia archaeon]